MIRRVALCLAACLLAAPAAAQIIPCPAIGRTQNYKLVLDDFSLSAGTGEPNLAVFMESLRASLRLSLERLQADTPLRVELVRCEKRRPKTENDFDKAQVRVLNSHRVVIEMWAIGEMTPGGGKQEYRAFVSYALIPVRHLVAGQVPDVVTVELKGRAGEPLAALLRELDQSAELAAYAAASLGTKLLQERDYDQARTYLCKADTTLAASRPQPPPGALVKWVRDLSVKVVEQAWADPNYTGAMRLREGQPAPACGK
jgi:hypothetical protein